LLDGVEERAKALSGCGNGEGLHVLNYIVKGRPTFSVAKGTVAPVELSLDPDSRGRLSPTWSSHLTPS
jgi:hypothetical protein